ncbi:MAG: ATP-binding protein [Thiolinea sp.]
MEIHPLIREFNHILALMQERLERSRHSLGNLAHALKGPLNLLRQSLEQETDTEGIRLARQQAEQVYQLMERELKRARLAGSSNTHQRFDPQQELPALLDVLNRIHGKAAGFVRLELAADTGVQGDREDMLELLGNLLDNAYKWADSRVLCQVRRVAGPLQIVISDDGPGCNTAQLEQMTGRGIRLDESRAGHGLGLSICKDIVRLYGGRMVFGRCPVLGGLRVEVSI